jgi:hypothetical protein
MARTTEALVMEIIDVESAISLSPFIADASMLVDDVATADTADEISDARLQRIETWLAAHLYTVRDPRTTQERAGQVAATYQSAVDKGLESSHYGQTAISLDPTGTLKNLSKGRRRATVTWLGTERD